MELNFADLRTGFSNYLEELYLKEGRELTSTSIFAHSDEFERYVSEELNLGLSMMTISVEDILDIDFSNIDPDETQAEEESEDSNIIKDFLSYLFSDDEEFISKVDETKDGNIDEDEVNNFLKHVGVGEDNSSHISMGDILDGLSSFKNDVMKTLQSNLLNSIANPSLQTAAPVSSGSAASAAAASGVPVEPEVSNRSGGRVSDAFMSEEDMQKELEKKETTLQTKQEALNAVYDGTNPTVKSWNNAVDEAYQFLLGQLEYRKVNQELIESLNNQVALISAKEAEISEKDSEISTQKTTVSNAKTAYESAVSTRETLESALSSMQGKSSDDPDEQAQIDAQISRLEGEVAAARAAESEAEAQLKEEEEKLDKLEEEKARLEDELDELNAQKSEIEAKIIETEPNIKEAIQIYNDKKKQADAAKETVLNNAKNAVEVAQQDVVAVKELINDNENRNLSLEYSSNFVGRDIAQFALGFLGYNEADASADIFLEKWHSSSSQTGWCAAFVSYIYEHMPSSDKIPQWYKDIENQYWQVNVHRAAEEAGAIIDSSQAETGDIVLYDYDGDGTMQHIGIVLAVEGNKLITIDGNSGNTVRINEVDLEHPATCPLTFCKIT
ncbi:TPA: CHAP domain-containing protein [Candidatus Galligastranaerophilus gallistercoris]|nr:CHAP domain-containing protein [Candidatus Galligastranaerophilus gallistercoris]